MGILTKTYATDTSKESDGVWVDVGVDGDVVARMRIRRMGTSNKKFAKVYAAKQKKLRFVRGEKLDLEQKALMEAFVEGCLIEWENIENIRAVAPGEVKEEFMPCNRENALLLFRTLPDLFDMIVGQAMELENFQSEANEDAAKNSFPSSNTN